jgi:hypothetical protein
MKILDIKKSDTIDEGVYLLREDVVKLINEFAGCITCNNTMAQLSDVKKAIRHLADKVQGMPGNLS